MAAAAVSTWNGWQETPLEHAAADAGLDCWQAWEIIESEVQRRRAAVNSPEGMDVEPFDLRSR